MTSLDGASTGERGMNNLGNSGESLTETVKIVEAFLHTYIVRDGMRGLKLC